MVNQYEYNSRVWFISCNSRKAEAILQRDQLFKLSSNPHYIVEAEELKIEGNAPINRVLHTAILYKEFIAIFGGKNNKEDNYCLNDLYLLNVVKMRWDTLVVYGFTPSGRWGHTSCLLKGQIMIFAGVGENHICRTSVHIFEDSNITNNL